MFGSVIFSFHLCFHSLRSTGSLKQHLLSSLFITIEEQRYFSWIGEEANLCKTRDFVFQVLLQHPDYGYKRAFRIIETELGLCYDFLFTKHQLLYAAWLWRPLWIAWFVFSLGKIILICVVGVYALKKSLILETPSPLIEVHSTEADYITALAFLWIILMVKLLETLVYLASDWSKVSLTCTYVKRKRFAHIAFMLKKALRFLNRITISGRCGNTIGQYSVISGHTPSHFTKMMLPSVDVSDAVKKAIVDSFISTHGELTKGETALRKFGEPTNGEIARKFVDECSLTWKDHSPIEIMLIWHIATDYCALALSDCGENRDVAISLSRYYAYLITFARDLVPYHAGDLRELMIIACEEYKTETLTSRRPSEIYTVMKDLEGTGDEDNPTTIFKKGVKLGKQLEKMSNNGVEIWKMMAEFWAETLIYITPSHATAKHHWEHLESGGEFLTHIWVLLTHAGILDLDRGNDQGTKPTQRTAEA